MKRPEHYKMQGKSPEEILADAKPLIDELQYFANDDSMSVWNGSTGYTGREFYKEVTSLGTLGREWVSTWHYMMHDSAMYRARRALRAYRIAFVLLLVIDGTLVLFRESLSTNAYCYLEVIMIASTLASLILAISKSDKVERLVNELKPYLR